jgi:hypothetical protein
MQRSTRKFMVCCVFVLWVIGNIWAWNIPFENEIITMIGISLVILSNPIILVWFTFIIARSRSIGFVIAIPIIFLAIWVATPFLFALPMWGSEVIERFLEWQFNWNHCVYWGVCMLTYSFGLYCGWKKNVNEIKEIRELKGAAPLLPF